MEWELYTYCTGMGALVIILILIYHIISGNEAKQYEQQGDERV